MIYTSGSVKEKIKGVVERVTYQNGDTGWSVLRVRPLDGGEQAIKVIVHQLSVFPGATFEFRGNWIVHPKYGRQFKSESLVELKPASSSALERYLGSGLIKGVGPKTAARIVRYFGPDTLDIFENKIEKLVEVKGIAEKKLQTIASAWQEHRAIRDVMMFLQSHTISTLFAIRIYKQYGDEAIARVSENPYRLAVDFFGIGFFSADKIALSLGFAEDSPVRIMAAIRHVLSASRDQGHCYLTREQISSGVGELLQRNFDDRIESLLASMEQDRSLAVRELPAEGCPTELQRCYYGKSLYRDESYVAEKIVTLIGNRQVDQNRIEAWLRRYEQSRGVVLGEEQAKAVAAIAARQCSILTGGPGCGKTTATKTLVALLCSMGLKVLLAAPTGRAAQRMTEVIGLEAKTIHRLLEYQGGRFKRNEENPLEAEYIIVDECSMLDIPLTASLLRAVSAESSLLLIGDPDQLPSVGAGNVLRDLLQSGVIPCYTLTKIFRQAGQSAIIQYAHQMNRGVLPSIGSPFKKPELWQETDCFFIDSDIATQDELRFIASIKQHYATPEQREALLEGQSPYDFAGEEYCQTAGKSSTPSRYGHVDLRTLVEADTEARQLMAVQKKVHPWSSLYYNLTALDVVKTLYSEWIPKYLGKSVEIQVLSPMVRGSLGTANLNRVIQDAVNPALEGRRELLLGEKIFREGDRVIHRRNNYDLGVFNGDIGIIEQIDNRDIGCVVSFLPDQRRVEYRREELSELEIAYAITVHKSQGSEFDVVILPVLTQHFRMLFRNLLYTGLTRAKRLAVFVGSRKALAMAVKNEDTSKRQTALPYLLENLTGRFR